MNPTAAIVVSVLAAAAAAVGISIAMQPEQGAGNVPVIAELQASLRQLQDQNDKLAMRLDEFATRPAPVAVPASAQRTEAPSVTPEQVAAAVEAYLQARSDGAMGDATGKGGAAAAFSVENDLKKLLGTSYWENTEAWKKAFAAGKMDEVIAEIEALAEANPNDVKAQMNLANAYMAYLQMDNSKWQLSMKADEQFDKVLAIDNTHWEARFTKAMSYTFWPEFLGKKQDAVSNFETLIEQQEARPVEDHFAQTYLFLGNMLSEREPERARAIWQQGLQRHPQNTELLQKLAK